jgi:hypothetical protein
VFRLKEHLYDVPSIELTFEINFNQPQKTPLTSYYELPVYEYGGGNHKD